MALHKMAEMNTIWKNRKISTKSKIRLALYGCQSWTLTKDMEARITSFEFKFYRRILRIPYTEHKSNEEVKNLIELEVGKIVNLLEVVRKRELQWFGHVVRQSGDSFIINYFVKSCFYTNTYQLKINLKQCMKN